MTGLDDLTHPPGRPPRLLYGADWNPEQWPEGTWTEDLRLMRRAGVTTVTLGVFSWARLEPEPGAREFGWLDRLMDLAHDHGVGVVLATPTASPPPWLGRLHPETLPRDEDGRTEWWGSRQHFSHSSEAYRRHAAALTEDLAARYARHPALVMWHINNEYCTYDWGDEAARTFRTWLQHRYGTLDALNTAWGGDFWSQRYAAWDEVLPPRRAHYLRNPAHVLDFRRYTSDRLLDCYRTERDIVRTHTPHLPVTTNLMPFWSGQDGWAWAAEQDLVSVDVYPDPAAPDAGAHENAFVADLTRSEAGGRPWMVMEQAAGAVNWRPVNHPKPEGLNRLRTLQAVARGADAVHSFQWRASRQGAEKFHSGMLGHSGPRGRGFRETVRIGADLARLGPRVAGSRLPAGGIALLHDWDSWWAQRHEGALSTHLDQGELVRTWHRALWEAGLPTTLAHPHHDLTAHPLVVVPHLYLLDDTALDNLRRYTAGGGRLVCGFFTGVADPDDRVRPGGMDARLRALLGIDRVDEWWPLAPGDRVDCGTFHGTLWSEELVPAPGTEILAAYRGGELDGRPAVLRHGPTRYLSTLPEPAALRALLAEAATEAGVRPVLAGLPDGVEAVRRGDLLFLLHHGREPVTVTVPGRHRDLLTGTTVDSALTLDRFGAAVLEEHP
ncbi:beta-galactosidase [Streptomyces sp. NPDC007863]|uniref:beta-galactosidase n=1 Tax=Streptomyces sp. NPDC007863 TaxID=3154894 RepID=UPI0033E0ED1A